MKFNELKKVFEDRLGIITLADIARELDVTPQVVSNWKSRNIVPYKYVRKVKGIIEDSSSTKTNADNKKSTNANYNTEYDDDDLTVEDILKFVIPYLQLFYKNIKYLFLIPTVTFLLSYFYLKYFAEPVFISKAKILPLGSQGPKISNIASSFGFQIGGDQKKLVLIQHVSCNTWK